MENLLGYCPVGKDYNVQARQKLRILKFFLLRVDLYNLM